MALLSFSNYRLATYLILFGFTLKPIFQKNLLWPCQVVDKSVSLSSSQKHKNSQDSSHASSEDSVLSHTCTLTPDIVREEVECLKLDFNNRVKQVLFNSMLTAYYMAFVPLCFAQVTNFSFYKFSIFKAPLLYCFASFIFSHSSLSFLSSFACSFYFFLLLFPLSFLLITL